MLLAIETSCDDSSVAVIDSRTLRLEFHRKISQEPDHSAFGGVVPELAARLHTRALPSLIAQARGFFPRLRAVAATSAPGLSVSLLIGVSAAKSLALALGCRLIGVNHLIGHVFSLFLGGEARLPLGVLLVSGGHTLVLDIGADGGVRVLAQTGDDSFGESFDKVAKMLGLGYPGGAVVERLAREFEADGGSENVVASGGENDSAVGKNSAADTAGKTNATGAANATGAKPANRAKNHGQTARQNSAPTTPNSNLAQTSPQISKNRAPARPNSNLTRGDANFAANSAINSAPNSANNPAPKPAANPLKFTIPLLHDERMEFSFSGLKNQTRLAILSEDFTSGKVSAGAVCAAFQCSAIAHIADKLAKLFARHKWRRFGVVGGASANLALRSELEKIAARHDCELLFAPLAFCSDNAAMIARAAREKLIRGEFCATLNDLQPRPKTSLDGANIFTL